MSDANKERASTTPSELTGEAWEALARRLGYADLSHWLRSQDMRLQPTARGWSANWIRLYSGVCSDRRWVDGCPSLPELCDQINAAEDEGDCDDDRRRAEGEDLPFAEVVR